MPLDNGDKRALNTAISGLKVSLSHINRLNTNGVLEGDHAERVGEVVAGLEEFRNSLNEV